MRSLVRKTDEKAFNHWTHLLQAIYNAGERSIDAEPKLFSLLIEVLIKQLKLVPNEWLSPQSKVVYKATYMIEDMIDTGIEDLKEKAQEFHDFLKTHGISG